MTNQQISVELQEVNGKVVILRGDEYDTSFLDQLKANLKKKGAEPLAIVLLPEHHHFIGADKEETISTLKEIIRRLEEK